MTTIASQFAEQLLSVQCIKVQPTQPFTWASGWLSPFYCDNRKTLAYPQVRTFVKEQLAALIRRQYPEATAIAGVATGAIAQGALVADELGLPMCYVRSKAKDHGMGNLIEGTLPEGARMRSPPKPRNSASASFARSERMRWEACKSPEASPAMKK